MEKKFVNQLDLFRHASEVAFSTLGVADQIELDARLSEVAKSSGVDAGDYVQWKGYVLAQRNTFAAYATRPLASARRVASAANKPGEKIQA